ncbi:MAG: dynamin family protein [Bacillota bacterium]|nr:dynamin family protein [Bacillota bacterium]
MDILQTTQNIQKTFEEYELCRQQADQVRILADKLQKKDVTIAVIGQFKRGKTTMVNSILGRKLLPTGIVPITSAVTRIEYADGQNGETAKVYFLNGLCEEVPVGSLHEYISEQENHDNERGVAEVELLTDSDFLKDGLILVDTPGVGSVHENNSKSAYDFARESDGVIFMLSVDSPINQIEVDFLKSVRKFAGKFYFTVNKIDTVDEDDLAEYLEYCTALLSDIMGYDDDDAKAIKLIPISAKKNIGIDTLTEMVRDDLLNKAGDIMKQSVSLKLLEILKNTGTQISSYREVLKMAPNVFNRRFNEMNEFLDTERAKLDSLEDKKYLRARLNEEKAYLTMKVRELFGIEYFYFVDRNDAAEFLAKDEYAAELAETYDELAETLNAIFMYKEENAYTVARRIEDLNILMQSMKKFARQIEQDMV